MGTCFGIYKYLDTKSTDKKSRNVAEIEKQLKKFYYPTRNFLNSYTKIVYADSERELRIPFNISFIEMRNSNPDYKDITRHQYLIKNNQTKYLFGEFVEKVLKSQSTQDKEDIDLYDRFKKIIEQDIEMYENELNELTMN